MLIAYIDESGTHDNSPVVTVAAFVGFPNVWEAWTRKWNEEKKPINIFHAVDANNFKGEFAGWNSADRDILVKRILPVIAESPLIGVAIGINMIEFRKALSARPDLLDVFPTPYAACLQWVLSHILEITSGEGFQQDQGPVTFVHEDNDYMQEAYETFEFVRDYSNPDKRALTFTFAAKSIEPLQAADVLAYESNRALRDPTSKTRKPWLAMDPKESKIDLGHFGKDNMHVMVDVLDKMKKLKDAQLTIL